MTVSFSFSRGKLIIPPVLMRHRFASQPVVALDTGARVSTILPEVATALGFEPEEMEPNATVFGATGEAPASILRVASVSVLGLEVKNLRVICHELHPRFGLQGILGLNFLRHFKIVIDNESETVTLTEWSAKNPEVKSESS